MEEFSLHLVVQPAEKKQMITFSANVICQRSHKTAGDAKHQNRLIKQWNSTNIELENNSTLCYITANKQWEYQLTGYSCPKSACKKV